MLFGFSSAIIVGFLLTAVQTWTGVPSIKNVTLAILVSVWLLARILLAFPFTTPPGESKRLPSSSAAGYSAVRVNACVQCEEGADPVALQLSP